MRRASGAAPSFFQHSPLHMDQRKRSGACQCDADRAWQIFKPSKLRHHRTSFRFGSLF
jgi:hypothetical protein